MEIKQETSSEYGISQELLVMSLLNSYGTVSIPYGNSARYDCILDISNKLIKLQIKALNLLDDDTINIPMANSRQSATGNVTKTYTSDEIDYIVICYNNNLYLFRPNLANKSFVVRINKPSLYNQHWIEDFRIDKILNIQIKPWTQLKNETRGGNPLKAYTKNYKCIDCGEPVYTENTRCMSCYRLIVQSNSNKPTREILKDKIKDTPFTHIGKEYNVTDNTVRKWCKSYNLPSKVKDIKEILEKGEWDLI